MNDKTASYMYQDTKQLVEFVEEAASLFEKTGESSFSEFSRKDSK